MFSYHLSEYQLFPHSCCFLFFDAASYLAKCMIAFYVFFSILAIFFPKCRFKSIVFFLGQMLILPLVTKFSTFISLILCSASFKMIAHQLLDDRVVAIYQSLADLGQQFWTVICWGYEGAMCLLESRLKGKSSLSFNIYDIDYKMLAQQISPWTIYDQHGNIVTHQSKPAGPEKPTIIKPIPPYRSPNKQLAGRRLKINDLLSAIGKQKSKLNEKINILICLKIVRHHLFEECSPVSQIKMHLPKIRHEYEKLEPAQIRKGKPRHNFYSQKLGVMNGMPGSALEDFSRIFVSASLEPESRKSAVVKPEFPKLKKNSSVLLADLEMRKQFDDNSLIGVIQSAKQSDFHKKISLSSLLHPP